MKLPFSKLVCATLLVAAHPYTNGKESGLTNGPPAISIVWPRNGDFLGAGSFIKIKTEIFDPGTSIANVRFYADTKLIGTVTNAPFSIVWKIGFQSPTNFTWRLKAVALDARDATFESAPVLISYYTGAVPAPVVEILSPANNTLFAALPTFDFSAEVLASNGDAGPVEFFIGTDSVGLGGDAGTPLMASTPPASIKVLDLPEGDYALTVRYRGGDGLYCKSCLLHTNVIRVVKLGVTLPSSTLDGRLQFDVVTSFPGKPVVTEASINLRDWIPISTNAPASNSFHFIDPNSPTSSARFYRVVVPP